MILVPRSRTLNEGYPPRRLTIGRTEDLAPAGTVGCSHTLEKDIRYDVGESPEPKVANLLCVVFHPPGRRHHGRNSDFLSFGLLLQGNSTVTARPEAGRAFRLAEVPFHNILRRECHMVRSMNGLRPGQSIVKLVGNLHRADGHALTAPRAGVSHVTRSDLDRCLIVARRSRQFFKFRQGEDGYAGIGFQAAQVDLKATGRRTEFGKVKVHPE